ncbi:hypothetical protein B0I27_11613 [Arcticibacter pallidicorallinus]|uniref:Uncharacterized protein n=1 Tax=Arcticibacter pallidicorallinus TaxID=1259464 RepID=A0A2T0TR08_9SPHI|nr:hypothetical protein [Arcticibacter pallidicorallinus]PRY48079.1 hypothetical protein B0I27_11613 [Arcticibacter pallidicorallinus]
MLKASALYLVVVIALIIAVFCASLITVAAFYRQEHQKSLRYAKLSVNLESGRALLLSSNYQLYDQEDRLDLFEEENDSVLLRKEHWGLFDLGTVSAFSQKDTLSQSFLIGLDASGDKSAIYLADEDRPLSVSGKTQIVGVAELPKAGIRQAYVDGRAYEGKELVKGALRESGRSLPKLNKTLILQLQETLQDSSESDPISADSASRSFFRNVKKIRISPKNPIVGGSYSGKIVLLCDTVLTIKKEARLSNVLVFAPGIIVENGFRGSCQLFAVDSVVTNGPVSFDYPSAIGVLSKGKGGNQPKITLGEGSILSGILFTHEEERSDLQTQISLGKNSKVMGEIYASGFIKFEKPVIIEGKVSCNRFIIQTPSTLYENYLIDITLNRPKRSLYYLTSSLFNSTSKNQRVLTWLK